MKAVVCIGGIIILVLGPGTGCGQVFRNVNAGFPLASTKEIFQDQEGFLWIGTLNGLARFDGYRMHFFHHDPADSFSIAASNITAIHQDGAGRVWTGLSGYGLDVLDKELKKFIHICLPDQEGGCMRQVTVNDLALDRYGSMWVGTDNGLFRFATEPEPEWIRTFVRDTGTSSLSSSYIYCLFIDSRDRLWVGTRNGINRYDKQHDGFLHNSTYPTWPADMILHILEDRQKRVYVSPRFSDACLLVLDEATQHFLDIPALRNRELGDFRITFDHDNGLWISSRGVGLFYADPAMQSLTFFDPDHFHHHGYRNIQGLIPMTDRYGNIWVTGTHLMQRPATGKAVHHVNTQEKPVISVYADTAVVWFSDSEPRRLDKKKMIIDDFWPGHLPTHIVEPALGRGKSKVIYAIREFDEHHVVMSSTRNIFIWNKKTGRFREYTLNYGGPFRDFALTADRSSIVICGNQGTPIMLDLRTGNAHRPHELSSIPNPHCVETDGRGNLWIGTYTDGIFMVEAATNRVVQYVPGHNEPAQRLSGHTVSDIAVAHDGRVWVATNLGINCIDPSAQTATSLRKQEHFDNEIAMSLIFDRAGDLWCATRQGLVRFNPDTGSFTAFDVDDGLINTVYSPDVACMDERGVLYFGGDKGIDIVDPARIGINPVAPDLYIGNILVNNQPVDTVLAAHHIQDLHLGHRENFLEIELLALHFTSPEANQYAYRIPEIDNLWRYLGTQRVITLANMQPGRYTLEARAANADGIWSENKTLLRIAIRPPVWATGWFMAACVLLAAGLGYFTYRYRLQQVRAVERLKAGFNRQIAEFESRALRAQMNPHFLFNSINSVKSLISLGESDKAAQYLTRFGQLIRQVLSNSEQPFVRLQDELEALRLYLAIEQLRFQNFEYQVSVNDDVDADYIEVPPLVLQPYVENAIWHGLMYKTGGERRLKVQVARDNRFLYLSVEDNGIGREQSRLVRMRGDARKGGMGMRLTEDRLALLNRLYGREVSVDILDLYNGSGKPAGTKVVIRIPYPE